MAQEHKITVQKFEPPVYPPIAKQAHIEGTVKLQLQVSAQGDVTDAKVLSGHPMLVRFALENVKKWRFHCDDCAYGEAFNHEMAYDFEIDYGQHGGRTIEYKFPDKVNIYTESPVIGLFAPELPRYFWLWKIVHPRYWHFHGFE